MRKRFVTFFCFSLLSIIISCGGSSSPDVVNQNSSPVAQILAPAEGSVFTVGDQIQFSGNCNDNEDGNLNGASLMWSSDIDGQIGMGETCSFAVLSEGTHQITLIGTDSEGAAGIDTVTITVLFQTNNNSAPVAQITNPTDGSAYNVGDEIQFTGSCSDNEDGNLIGASLVWRSDLDGQIGTGKTFSLHTLSAGIHLITLTGTDAEATVGMDTVTINVNAAPVVQITSPADGSAYNAGNVITFAGSANDKEDGDLSGTSLVWSSDIDGQIGTGETCSSNSISVGVHQIKLTATDSSGSKSSYTIDLTIKLSNPIPDTGQITSYTTTFGEDADYTINPPSYTKLDVLGNELDVGAIRLGNGKRQCDRSDLGGQNR